MQRPFIQAQVLRLVLGCLAVVAVLASVLVSGLASIAAQPLLDVHELEQTPASPDDDNNGVLGDGFDVTEGLAELSPEEIEGHELGSVLPPASIDELLDEDGLFEWEDASGTTALALLGSAAASTSDGATGTDATTLSELATSAAVAYAPPHDGQSNNTSTVAKAQQTANNWFVSDTGQLFLPVGGVLVAFESDIDEVAARQVLSANGVVPERVSPIEGLPGAYSIATSSDVESFELVRLLADAPGVELVTPNLFTPKATGDIEITTDGTESVSQSYENRDTVAREWCQSDNPPYSDALSRCLWHIDRSKASYTLAVSDSRLPNTPKTIVSPLVDINMGNVWDTTKGSGITVSVVDRTWEAGHEDLVGNASKTLSTYWGGKTGEFENAKVGPAYHGTAVAGVIGARDNNIGGRGVAPRATLLNVNYLDAQSTINNQKNYTHNKNTVAVANHSYSNTYDGPLNREHPFVIRALEESLKSGYGGKGIVHVKVAGNGHNDGIGDETALEESLHHRGHIVTCAVNSAGTHAVYSEVGSNLWVCAPGGSFTRHGMFGPIGKDKYHARLIGTSYAAPVVSGVAALLRSVNSALTWRDVKLILANTAQKNDSSDSSWKVGAKKYGSTTDTYSYSRKYGFGLVDATAAVAAAKTWKNLPKEVSNSASAKFSQAIPRNGTYTEFGINLTSDINFIEHVDVSVGMQTAHFRSMKLVLVAPSGRESLLVDSSLALGGKCRCPLNGSYTFGSTRHLGESAGGMWKLRVYRTTSVPAALTGFGVTVYGHNASRTELVKLSAPHSVTEGQDITVTVERPSTTTTNELVVPLVVTPALATPPGQPGADYTALASITIPAGATQASATISTTHDDKQEPTEGITIAIGALPIPYAADSGKQVIIYDDDRPSVSISAVKSSINEGEPVELKITMHSDPIRQTVVNLSISETPTPTAYLEPGNRTPDITFTAKGTKTYTLQTVQDKIDDPTRQVRAEIVPHTAIYTVSGRRDVYVTITDELPRVSIVSSGDINEGADATFTLEAVPAPKSSLSVEVAVDETGFFGVDASTRTVTIGTNGTGTLSIPTVRHKFTQPEGSVTATVKAPSDDSYYPAPRNGIDSATVKITDIDKDALAVDPAVVGKARARSNNFAYFFRPARRNAWKRALLALGENPSRVTGGKITVSEAQAYANQGENDSNDWLAVITELNRLETARAAAPVVIVSGGGDITEGDDAVFTLRALPGPATDVDVEVMVAAGGRFGVTAGSRTVTIPAGGTVDLTVATSDDGFAGSEGAVTVTVVDGTAYDVYSKPSASVAVTDVGGTQPPTVPVVSITAGGDVTEGSNASFTVSASPAPASPLSVSVDVTATGSFGVTTGSRTVTIPTSGSASLTVATSGDSTDEADGSVTVTLSSGTGYTVSSTASSASVNVADDDVPEISITAGSNVTEGSSASFTLTASPAPAAALSVSVNVTATGSFGVTTGSRTVTIPTSGSATLTVATSGDSTDEADGSVTVTLSSGTGYTVSSTAGSATVNVADDDVPEISITAGSNVTEGSSASFTLTASPVPASSLTVTVNVSATGNYGVTTGSRTVTIPTTGTATLTVSTSGDSVDEADGSVTATLASGTGYTVSSTAGSATVNVADDDVPEISITAGSDVTEGSNASFTLTASPVPASSLTVTVNVTSSGSFGVTTGSRTVTIPTSGSATLTVSTSGDSTDETDGSVTVTLASGTGYTVSSTASSATVNVADDDDAQQSVVYVVPAKLVSDVRGYAAETGNGVAHVNRWKQVLLAFGEDVPGFSGTPMTVADAQQHAQTFWSVRWDPVVEALQKLAANPQQPAPATPEISITAGSNVTEGSSASFTLTASPVPASSLTVTVNVTSSGDYGVTKGSRTVTIPTTGTATLTVSTSGDSVDEADGSVTATLASGTGYTVSSTAGSATVNVADDDVPEISITAGSDVTEGSNASFTLTASPVPASSLTVTVNVTSSGSFGVTTGSRTVTIPTSGSATLTVSTSGDSTDETDGSVTVTLASGTGYTVSSTASSATVNVADDDDAQQSVVYVVPAKLVSDVRGYAAETGNGVAHVNRWKQVLLAFGEDVPGFSGTPMTVADAQQHAQTFWSVRWDPVVEALQRLAANPQQPAPATPEISITAGSNVTEGSSASFTLTASPVPASSLTVTVNVSASGDFGVTTGSRTVTVPTSGTATLTVSTTGDSTDEADGSVTATLASGTGYTVSSTAGSATVNVADDDVPEISITAGSDVTEGSNASFTLTASPVPASSLTVTVNVTSSGSFGVTTGSRTVTIPTSGSATLTVSTSGDSTDETDGSVTVTLASGTGYTVSSTASSATVNVADDDDAQQSVVYVVPAKLVSDVRGYAAETGNGVAHVNRWKQVLLAFGEDVPGFSGTPMTVADAQQHAQTFWSVRWDPVVEALQKLAANPQQPAPATPEISITAGSNVTEGSSASFTLTANPTPAASLTVTVNVSASGDFGVTTGSRTVTVPTSGTATLTVSTTGDSTDEADGSVTATLASGTGYTVSSTAASATVNVADDDDPPPPATPEISITAGSNVTEGGNASFTLTANPTPAASLTVTVNVSAQGDYGVTTGSRTVTVPTSGTATLTVATTGDSIDEADGSVTATLASGTGYTVSSTAASATVNVADDDDPPPPPPPVDPPQSDLPVLSIADATYTEGSFAGFYIFYVLLNKTSAQQIEVRYRVEATGTGAGHATAGADFFAVTRTMSFRPGISNNAGLVVIPNDRTKENNETFRIVLFDPKGATIAKPTATITIKDND